VRVVIAEDEALLRQGLALVLEQDGFEVVSAVGTAAELEDAVGEHQPQLVITDIRMPPTFTDEGLVAAHRIRASSPDVAIVVLSQHVQRRYAIELVGTGQGKVGYLLKQRIADVRTFTQALRRVVRGGTALDPDVVEILLSRAQVLGGGVERLTPRQREGIAGAIGFSEKAVVQHTSKIYDALGLAVDADDHRRVLAVLRYLTR